MKKAILSLTFILLLISLGRAYSSDLPKVPMLRMETGMHTALINRIGIDAQNRFLVSGSSDKTVRVWELSTGKLIKILRPPIEEGLVGRILSVGISSDGKTIACGGRIEFAWEKSQSLYLFDRESGKLIHRIKGLPDVSVYHLAYSKDSKFLVATLGGDEGIRIYHTLDYSIAGFDKGYIGSSGSADFDVDGWLVTASDDGFVRLYRERFQVGHQKESSWWETAIFCQFFS